MYRLSEARASGTLIQFGLSAHQPGIIAIPGALLPWLAQSTARSARDARRRVTMRTETETRWIVVGTDGRHVSLGRSEPSEAEMMAASDALAARGFLDGWQACRAIATAWAA